MTCPKCNSSNVTMVNNSHYVCNNPNCVDEKGARSQFSMVEDDKVQFPYNQIFVNRRKDEFYRKPYLRLATVGSTEVVR